MCRLQSSRTESLRTSAIRDGEPGDGLPREEGEAALDFERTRSCMVYVMTALTEQKTKQERLTIQQAAAELGVSTPTLRSYERAGLVPEVGRISGGHRRYGRLDLAWAVFVRKLRRAGMSIGAIRRYAELQRIGADTLEERVKILKDHRIDIRDRLRDLQETLSYLEGKIAHYEDVLDGKAEDVAL